MERKFEILIVDDDVNLASNLQDILEVEGYNTAVAHDGQTALTLCRQKVFAVALIDIKLPDISGIKLIDKLHELSGETVYIITTGYASMDSAIEAVKHRNIVAYETKPLNMNHLLALIAQIAERKQAEEALRESEEKLQRMFESASDGIVVTDLNANIMEMNEAAVRLYGSDSVEKLIGQSAFELIAEKDRLRIMEILKSAQEDGQIRRNVEITFLTEDGREYLAEVSSALLRDAAGNLVGFVAIFRDISERKQAEERLRESEAKYSVLVEKSADGIIIVQDGALKFVNPMALKLVGFTPEELIGVDFLKMVTPEARETVMKRYTDRLAGKEVPNLYEIALIRKDGTTVPVEVNATLISYQGRPADLVLVRDISERKQAEEEARQLETLRELDQLRKQLLANVSHELRTPLASIKGYATMLLDYDTRLGRGEKRECLKSIDKATIRLTKLVDNLLDMSRLEVGLLKPEKTPTSISKLLREVVAEAQVRALDHRIVLEVTKRLPRGNIDARRIRQVLDNLIDNATKYSRQGTQVVVSAQQAGQELLFRVADQGIGIPSEELVRIFDSMYYIGRRLTPGAEGAGLGLAICKGLVEAHGGRIWMESEEGRGCTCIFTLPLDTKGDR